MQSDRDPAAVESQAGCPFGSGAAVKRTHSLPAKEVEKTTCQSAKTAQSLNNNGGRGGSVCDDPQLPKREIAFYLVALLSIIGYAGLGFYETYGLHPAKMFPPDLLTPGWIRDFKDYSADAILDEVRQHWLSLLVAIAGYLLVSKLTLAFAPMACHQLACSVYTVAACSLTISPQATIALLIAYAIALCVAYYSYLTVCLLTCTVLYALNMSTVVPIVYSALRLTEPSANRYAAMYGYFLCRLISLSHTLRTRLAKQAETGESLPTLPQFLRANLMSTLHYAFYAPYMSCGPILTFEMFLERLEARGYRTRVDSETLKLVAWRAFRMLLWFFLLELIYHYLPVGSYLFALAPNRPIVYKHLAFAMFLQGQNFMLIYLQFYGWAAAIARLDGIPLLHWPACISWVYSYSIMWRVFDRGLFTIIQAHVYFPLGGSRRGRLRQILAVIACFAFICVFHGDTWNVRAWVACNALQLIGERIVVAVYKQNLRAFVTKHLSPRNEKRLVGYAIAWNMMASCGIIFLFLAGPNGFIVLPEFLLLRPASWHTPVWHMLTMQFAAYCAVQIGRYYEAKAPDGVASMGDPVKRL